MKRTIIAVLIFGLVLVSCTSRSPMRENSDDLFRSKIVGSWAEGENPYSIATFENGGRYYGRMWESPQKKNLILVAEGRWWIENGRLYNTVHEFKPHLIPSIDNPIVDIIVSISANVMILIDDRGKQYTKTKVE